MVRGGNGLCRSVLTACRCHYILAHHSLLLKPVKIQAIGNPCPVVGVFAVCRQGYG